MNSLGLSRRFPQVTVPKLNICLAIAKLPSQPAKEKHLEVNQQTRDQSAICLALLHLPSIRSSN